MTSDGRADSGAPAGRGGAQRIDKWLWYTRAIKSRTLAAGLVEDGRVRINREKITKPSHAVEIGDVVTASVNDRLRILKVVALGVRRGPASEGQSLYEDLTPPPVPAAVAEKTTINRDPGSGRPTKKQRRDTDRLRARDEP